MEHPLPSQARFLRDQAEREEREGVRWTDEFPEPLRNRLIEAYRESFPQLTEHVHLVVSEVDAIHRRYSHRAGEPDEPENVLTGFSGDDDDLLDMLDAISVALDNLASEYNHLLFDDGIYSGNYNFDGDRFRERANAALLMFRSNYKFVGHRLVPRSAEELHREVVMPLEALLTDNPAFASANNAYGEALRQLRDGHFGASVTSAGSVLHEVLVALGARGGNLSALFADARRKGLLAGHDIQIIRAFESIGDWVNGERSHGGNAHGASSADADDAWLAIHLVGALVVRLVSGRPRDVDRTAS